MISGNGERIIPKKEFNLNQAPMMNAIWKQVVEEKTKHRD
jgi:hypothetical protein